MEEWIVIVIEKDRAEAKRKFEIWKRENALISKNLTDDDIRIDTIRTENKTDVTRYRIKKSSI